ncbi:phosphoglycerate kinase, partial [Bacillus mycoides]|uniref:phosphoglycerate kinase n=1 Tax=Bacillus mycoides TaxID=1405 RepID=UPI0011AA824C
VEEGGKVILGRQLGGGKGEVVEEMRVSGVGGGLGEVVGKDVKKGEEGLGGGVEEMVAGMKEGAVLVVENVGLY